MTNVIHFNLCLNKFIALKFVANYINFIHAEIRQLKGHGMNYF